MFFLFKLSVLFDHTAFTVVTGYLSSVFCYEISQGSLRAVTGSDLSLDWPFRFHRRCTLTCRLSKLGSSFRQLQDILHCHVIRIHFKEVKVCRSSSCWQFKNQSSKFYLVRWLQNWNILQEKNPQIKLPVLQRMCLVLSCCLTVFLCSVFGQYLSSLPLWLFQNVFCSGTPL